jgi:transposase-like protein
VSGRFPGGFEADLPPESWTGESGRILGARVRYPEIHVSKLCKDIGERVGAFLDRLLSGEWPYLWLDATYLRQREGGRIVSIAAIIAVACDAEGRREIVSLHIGPSEAETFYLGVNAVRSPSRAWSSAT